MKSKIYSYLKFFIKIRIVHFLRNIFLFLFGARPNKENWQQRILIINLEAIGDVVVFTSVLKHYKKALPDKKIYLLLKENIGIEEMLKSFVDETIFVNYKKFATNPFYGFRYLNFLRNIGFQTVINQDFSSAEIIGKIISVNIGAKEIIGYEGCGLLFERPFDLNMKKNLSFIEKKIHPLFTKLIPSIDRNKYLRLPLINVIDHYKTIYESVTGRKEDDYSTQVFVKPKTVKIDGKYVVVVLGSSVAYKNWPVENFVEVSQVFKEFGWPVVLVGSSSEKHLSRKFKELYAGKCVDLVGQINIEEVASVIKDSFLLLSNDTGPAHIAVALKKPSITILGGGQFGMISLYGYTDINKWIYKEQDCFGDNWRCTHRTRKGEPTKCISSVPVVDVVNSLQQLINFLKENTNTKEVFKNSLADSKVSTTKKLKILYTGIQKENYSQKRGFGFEYNNFYLTLKSMPGMEVFEYPLDSILEKGRKRFNEDLLELVKNEKPDLFFSFMFTDELDKQTLKEIKNLTTSIAWFSDDSWRFYNYTRYWSPYFTWIITTYSWIPDFFKKIGYFNIIRSQWGANAYDYKPILVDKDIDVSFIGQYNSNRDQVISELRRAGINVFVRGWKWSEGRISQQDMIKVFSRSKINLNINSQPRRFRWKSFARLFLRRSAGWIIPDFNLVNNFYSWMNIGVPQIKARPFELAACKTFVISGFADDLDKFYKENEEMVFYRSTEELIEKIKRYLPLETEREKIADAGYKRTLAEHTYQKRFEDIFKRIGLKYDK